MSFDPTDFYEFSSWMKERLPDPFRQSVARSIISRAYYSALLHASDYTGLATVGGHSKIISNLRKR